NIAFPGITGYTEIELITIAFTNMLLHNSYPLLILTATKYAVKLQLGWSPLQRFILTMYDSLKNLLYRNQFRFQVEPGSPKWDISHDFRLKKMQIFIFQQSSATAT